MWICILPEFLLSSSEMLISWGGMYFVQDKQSANFNTSVFRFFYNYSGNLCWWSVDWNARLAKLDNDNDDDNDDNGDDDEDDDDDEGVDDSDSWPPKCADF